MRKYIKQKTEGNRDRRLQEEGQKEDEQLEDREGAEEREKGGGCSRNEMGWL